MTLHISLFDKILNWPRRFIQLFTPWRMMRTWYYLKTGQYHLVFDRFLRLLINLYPDRVNRIPGLEAMDESLPLHFPRVDQPAVSIIIPVYNQLDYTLRCLRSIASTPARNSYQVIVLDDASSDGTAETLGAVENLLLVRNPENLGFILTCNRATEVATGEFLLFLNNDTLVLPGWLDELVETFRSHDDAGLVGSKLLFPNGFLQEAGGLIWNDASAWNYGRGEDPQKPEYSHLREVDYCSGACLMIPRALFAALGGFDPWYLPAYGEDSDLAFRVREKGLKVFYQPLSRVVHYEGMTSGKSVKSGVKVHQVNNKEKLFDRWAHRLYQHAAQGEYPLLERERNVKHRVLVVDAFTPMPDHDAGSLKIFNFIKIFISLGYKVTFAPDNMAFDKHYSPPLQRMGVECLCWPYTRNLRTHLKKFGKYYDFILSCRPEITENYLDDYRRYCSRARVLYDTADLHYLRERRQAEIEGKPSLMRAAEKRRNQELRLVASVDCSIVVSDREKDILSKEVPGAKVATISAVHDLHPVSQGFAQRADLMFLGGYQHVPNVDAVLYFVEQTFPLIRQRLPGVKFIIVGSRAPESIQKLACDDVVVAGYVPDLDELLGHCRIAVNPLRYGAGVKGKIVTAMAHGLPCVGTSIAFEGMEVVDGRDVLTADGVEDFAEAVCRLYQDEAMWQSLSQHGIEVVERHYSFTTARQRFETLLQALLPAPLPPRVPATLYGSCNVCGARTHFRTLGSSHYRESLICNQCGAGCRQRALAGGLLAAAGLPVDSNLRQLALKADGPQILDTDAFSAIFRNLRQASFYLSSIYRPELPAGAEVERCVRNVDLMKMPFPDGAFDIILTSDVMEHVRRDDLAHAEIYRCLKPGGHYVFTVPFVSEWEKNQIRVDSTGEADVFLMEPQYHGDPLNKKGALVYRIYGRELIASLEDLGFEVCFDNKPIYWLGKPVRDVFICRKKP